MKYALLCHQTDLGDQIRFVGPCVITGKFCAVVAPKEGFKKWLDGEYIQKVMPELSPNQREFLMSGISPEAYDYLYKEDESEEGDAQATEEEG